MKKIDEIFDRIKQATIDINDGFEKISETIQYQDDEKIDNVKSEIDSIIKELEQVIQKEQ
jgi:2-hydroxy-3-keto-5-methylthiopentenyl-1-phosphate phosphatase|tara:strand:+ start:365 stop:544 length:180 start_codon:yes stop_codon:yes gene_type:complete